jgi:hypothetical protein
MNIETVLKLFLGSADSSVKDSILHAYLWIRSSINHKQGMYKIHGALIVKYSQTDRTQCESIAIFDNSSIPVSPVLRPFA